MAPAEKPRLIFGYAISGKPLFVSICAIFATLTTIFTTVLVIPIPATGGYFNFGDAGAMITGLLFGPWVGCFAGGIGSMLGDVLLGYYAFAPLTLLAKGLEGLLVGLIADPRNRQRRLEWRDFAGVGAGGAAMVLMYFTGEYLFFGGVGAALGEIPANLIQIGGGVLIALAVTMSIRKNLLAGSSILRTTFFPNVVQVERGNAPAGSEGP